MSHIKTAAVSLAFISAAIISSGHASNAAAQDSMSSTFKCKAWRGQTCYFSVIRAREKRLDFTLKSGESIKIDGVVPVFDRYIVQIDRKTPDAWQTCGRIRGIWCKQASVSAGTNS